MITLQNTVVNLRLVNVIKLPFYNARFAKTGRLQLYKLR